MLKAVKRGRLLFIHFWESIDSPLSRDGFVYPEFIDPFLDLWSLWAADPRKVFFRTAVQVLGANRLAKKETSTLPSWFVHKTAESTSGSLGFDGDRRETTIPELDEVRSSFYSVFPS
jgi:hypothetical protein